MPERAARNPLAARHGRAVRYATARFVCQGLSLPGRHLYNGEGKEYQLFRELKVSPYSTNETLVRQWKGKDTCWWERTASPDTSESEGTLYMNRVGHDGDVFTYATPAEKPNKLTCVIPGFCI